MDTEPRHVCSLGRHEVFVAPGEYYSPEGDWLSAGEIRHPEHSTLVLPREEGGLNTGDELFISGYAYDLLPGTSQPFAQRQGD